MNCRIQLIPAAARGATKTHARGIAGTKYCGTRLWHHDHRFTPLEFRVISPAQFRVFFKKKIGITFWGQSTGRGFDTPRAFWCLSLLFLGFSLIFVNCREFSWLFVAFHIPYGDGHIDRMAGMEIQPPLRFWRFLFSGNFNQRSAGI